MKRYQCIKNYAMDEKAHQMSGEIAFKAGKVYPCKAHINGCLTFESEISPYHSLFEDTVNEYFQELLDLNVDDYAVDQDEKHVYPVASPNVSLGCAIAIAAAITAGFFIYKIITWNS